jgi:katanin p80 WD40 repeat-containing subunit B1
MQINCLEIAPDGKWFASGAQDSLIKLWDIGSGKTLYTFNLHSAPVTCLKFNPYDLTLASGSADKTIKYWDLEKFGMLCSTKPEATGIQSINFDTDGKYLYSAAQDTLKVWHVDADNLTLTDSVESGWRGVQDLSVQVSPRTDEENLLGTAITSSSFGLWCCPLRRVNRDPMITPEKFMQMRKQAAAKREQEQKHAIEIEKPINQDQDHHRIPPQNVFVAQAQNNLLPQNNPFPMGHMGMNQNSNQLYPSDMFQPYPNNIGFNQHSMPVEQIDQFANMMAQGGDQRFSNNFNPGGFGGYGMGQENNFNMLNADPHRRISLQRLPGQGNNEMAMNEERPPLKEEDSNTKDSSSIIKASDPMSMSTFMKDIESDNKVHFDAISDITKDHAKFKAFMKQRLDHLELVLHYWNSGNIRSALNAINILNLNDSTLIMDLLNMSSAVNKTSGQMNVEAACIFLQKALQLIDSKFDHHVKMGFKFIDKTFKQFYEEIVHIKTANVMNMVDLAREERLKKYDKLITEFEAIAQKERIKRLAAKNKDEVGELANRLLTELELFLTKIKKR